MWWKLDLDFTSSREPSKFYSVQSNRVFNFLNSKGMSMLHYASFLFKKEKISNLGQN